MRIEPWKRNLVLLAFAQVIALLGLTFVLPFVPLFVQEELGVTNATDAARWTSVIAAASAISMAFAQPFWGNLADRYGRKPMVVRSMFGAGICLAAMAFASAPWHLLVIRLFQGMVTGTATASNALVATTAPKERMGFAMGVMQLAVLTGMSVGPMFGGYVAAAIGARGAFYAAGGLSLLGGLIVLALVSERFVRPPKMVRPSTFSSSKRIFGLPFFAALCVLGFLVNFTGVIVMPMLSLFVAGLHGGEDAASAAGLVLGIGGIASAVASLSMGRVGDQLGHGRILLVCLIGVTLTTLPQGFVTDLWQLMALRVLSGLFVGGLVPSMNALVVRAVVHEERGAAFGLTGTAGAVAAAAGPLLGAAIVSVLGLGAVFTVTGILLAVGSAWIIWDMTRHKELLAAVEPEGKAALS